MALHGDEAEFMNLREWDRRARLIRKSPTSRRFSTSYIGSFREDHHKSSSSKTNFNHISSTASSPGYLLKEEIDPSKYSFTYALKALQAKTMHNNREWLAQERFTLNSKWNEAERYISNPFSGEVPIECLSSKTLSARSFRNFTTMSGPLHYPKSNPMMNIGQHNKPIKNTNVRVTHEDLYPPEPVLVREKKVMGLKRDVGIQSKSVDLSSGSPSPAKTPPIIERSLKRHMEANDSSVDFNLELEAQHEAVKLVEKEDKEEKQHTSQKEEDEEKQTSEEEEEEERSEEEEEKQQTSEEEEEKEEKKKRKKKRGSGCFSWVRSGQRRARKSKYIFPVCVPYRVKGC